MIERWHRSLKASIMCQEESEWTEFLPMVLLGLRSSYKEDIKATAAEMVYGTCIKMPAEFLLDFDEVQDIEPEIFLKELKNRKN